MRLTTVYRSRLVLCAIALFAIAGCDASTASPSPETTVVVFTALDRVHSEPLLKRFERETGIRVRPVYDAESAKTTGLVNRLLARRGEPECDVLWNNEPVQTVALAQQGLFASYQSPVAARIPAAFRDPKHRWTGFAGRLRVLIYNTTLLSAEPPATLSIFADPSFREQGVIALPYYGTTFTHMCVLRERWGDLKFRHWLDAIRQNGTAFAPGNGAACDLVASGERAFGLTDTDDAYGAIQEGKPIAVIIPDPEDGAVLMPNTVSLIAGAPNPQAGRQLIDFLLSAEVEQHLATSQSVQIPLGNDLQDLSHPWQPLLREATPRALPLEAIAEQRSTMIRLLREAGLTE